MTLTAVDWLAVLDALPAWHALSQPAREVALQLPPGARVPGSRLGARRGELERAGLVRPIQRGSRVEVAETYRPLLEALRRMKRSLVFERPGRAALERYLAQQLSSREVRELGGVGGARAGHAARRLVASRAASRSWLSDLLGSPDSASRASDSASRRSAPRPADERVFTECRRLTRALVEAGEAVPAAELAAEHSDRRLLARALGAGLGRLYFLVGLSPESRLPVVGIYPPALDRLRRPRAEPPPPVEVDRPFRSAVLLDEMTTVLVAAIAEPPRLTSQASRLFARARRDLGQRLQPLPEPIARLLKMADEERVDRAVVALSRLGYVESRGRPGADLRLTATEAGREWLAEDPKTRLQAILDLLLGSLREDPKSSGRFLSDSIGYLPRQTRRELQFYGLDLATPLVEAFGSLEVGRFVDLPAFLRHHAEERNPLPALGADNRFGSGLRFDLTEEQLERLWAEVLYDFFAARLFALGGAAVAALDEERVAFAVTDAGRYLLGLTDDFEYHEGGGEIVVQPDFEIIFLAPSAQAEAALGRFAERQEGHDLGALFRLTRDAIFTAAAGGLTGERVLGTLERLSSKPIPANVRRQLEEWFASCRRVTAEPAMLIECADRDTALRLLAAGGGALRPVGETVVAVEGGRLPPALIRKLRRAGLFVALAEE